MKNSSWDQFLVLKTGSHLIQICVLIASQSPLSNVCLQEQALQYNSKMDTWFLQSSKDEELTQSIQFILWGMWGEGIKVGQNTGMGWNLNKTHLHGPLDTYFLSPVFALIEQVWVPFLCLLFMYLVLAVMAPKLFIFSSLPRPESAAILSVRWLTVFIAVLWKESLVAVGP